MLNDCHPIIIYYQFPTGAFVDEYIMKDPDAEIVRQFEEAQKQEEILDQIQKDHDYTVKCDVPMDTKTTCDDNDVHAVDRIR